MTSNRRRKKAVRERMSRTGERYTEAERAMSNGIAGMHGLSTAQTSHVGMGVARHPKSGAQLNATDIPSQAADWPRPLHCYFRPPPNSCHVSVGPVNTQRTEHQNPPAPHFRLYKHEEHAADCHFNVKKRIDVIRQESGGELRTVRDREGQRRRYRLSLPTAFTASRAQKSPEVDPRDRIHIERQTRLINTAVKVAELVEDMRLLRSDPECDFDATCDGQPVPWDRFFYTRRNAWSLIHYYRGKTVQEPRPPLPHPIAIVFSVRAPKRIDGWVLGATPTPDGYKMYDDDKHVRSEEILFCDGPSDLLANIFRDRGGNLKRGLFIGFGIWEMITKDPKYPPALTLRVRTEADVAPLPDTTTQRVLDEWRNGRPLTRQPDSTQDWSYQGDGDATEA